MGFPIFEAHYTQPNEVSSVMTGINQAVDLYKKAQDLQRSKIQNQSLPQTLAEQLRALKLKNEETQANEPYFGQLAQAGLLKAQTEPQYILAQIQDMVTKNQIAKQKQSLDMDRMNLMRQALDLNTVSQQPTESDLQQKLPMPENQRQVVGGLFKQEGMPIDTISPEQEQQVNQYLQQQQQQPIQQMQFPSTDRLKQIQNLSNILSNKGTPIQLTQEEQTQGAFNKKEAEMQAKTLQEYRNEQGDMAIKNSSLIKDLDTAQEYYNKASAKGAITGRDFFTQFDPDAQTAIKANMSALIKNLGQFKGFGRVMQKEFEALIQSNPNIKLTKEAFENITNAMRSGAMIQIQQNNLIEKLYQKGIKDPATIKRIVNMTTQYGDPFIQKDGSTSLVADKETLRNWDKFADDKFLSLVQKGGSLPEKVNMVNKEGKVITVNSGLIGKGFAHGYELQ